MTERIYNGIPLDLSTRLEWDPAKALIVKEKHGIDIELVVSMFLQRVVILPAISVVEKREKAVGQIEGRFVTAIFTRRQERLRLITARRSRDNEIRAFGDYDS